jgi:TRAP-type C4-dicarboxylate transport system substrate-binding protein
MARILSIITAMLVLLVFAFFSPIYAADKVVNLTYSDLFPAPHANAKLAAAWCKEVEKRTGGKVKITYYPGQSLTKGKECYDGVVSGLSDIGQSVLQYTAGRFPLMDFINLPLGYKSGAVNTAIINEVYKKFNPKELQDTKVMYLHAHGPGYIHTKNKPIRKLEDFKGVKIRSHGPTAEMIKGLGGTPVGFPMPELYQSLQKGVVDGGVFPMEALKGWKLAEVTNYHIQCPTIPYSLGFFVVMNKKKWDSLPEDAKKAIEKINLEWVKKQGKIWDDIDKEGTDFALKKGGKIIKIEGKEAERWAKAVRPAIDIYLKDTKAKGVPGADVLKYVTGRLK